MVCVAVSPPGTVVRFGSVDDETESIITLSKHLWFVVPRRFDEPAHCVFEVPPFRLVLRIADVIYVVMYFSSEIDVLIIPGNIVPGVEILTWRRLVAMVSEPIDCGIVPWSMLDPIDVPDSVVERKFFPL